MRLVSIIVTLIDLQKDKELEKLQNLLKARCSQVEKLQRNLSEQTEKIESFKNQVSSLTDELVTLKTQHEQCQQKDDRSSGLQEQIVQLKHSLLREQSNNEAMMQAFQEQEKQWEEEKTKILSSMKNGSDNAESLIAEENVGLKRKLEELERDLNAKEREHTEILQQTEKRASSATSLKLDLQNKVRALESHCEELKYKLVQKGEEIFEKDECLKKTNLEVSRLEAKYVAAEEVERELRHHLGEVTQQLEWSKENKTEPGDRGDREGDRDEDTDQQKLKEDLNAAKERLEVCLFLCFSFLRKNALYVLCFVSAVKLHSIYSTSAFSVMCPGARFSKAPKSFRARKAIFRSSVSKNGEVYTPETSCMKGTSLHL